ncbi:MAG: hypothetical protein AB1500_06670 [Bacillota bacterium]
MATSNRYRVYAVVLIVVIAVALGARLLIGKKAVVTGPDIVPGDVTRVIAGKPGQELNTPLDVAVAENGRTYIADSLSGRVQVFSRWGRPQGLLGQGKLSFSYPNTVAVDAKGNVYVGEFVTGQIRVFTDKGKLLRTLDAKSTGAAIAPLDMAVARDGGLLIADRRGAVLILDRNGRVQKRLDRIQGASPETLSYPNGIVQDEDTGRILVADSGNRRLLVLDREGKLVRTITSGKMSHPRGVCFFDGKYIVAADTFKNDLLVFDLLGRLVKIVKVTNQPGLTYIMPNGLCVYEDRLYVADRAHNIVLVFGRGT